MYLAALHLEELDIARREIASAVLELQRRAYRIEAALLGSDEIPPLHESLEELQASGETFLGAFLDGILAGAISWRVEDGVIDLHRLVVDPSRHRAGVGTALVRAALVPSRGRARFVRRALRTSPPGGCTAGRASRRSTTSRSRQA